MDNLDRQFGEMFSQIRREKVPADFSAKVLKKIDAKKERRIKLNEELFQGLFISIYAIILCLTMFLLNKYYLHADFGSVTAMIRNMFVDISDIFKRESVFQWSIIVVNTMILIFLEQFLSRKLSKKL